MAQYVVLINFTEQGAKNLKRGAEARQQAEQAIAGAGGRIIWQGLTMGQYDAVAVVELPGDEQALGVALGQAMQGDARTQTLKAFSPDVVDPIIARLGG